MEKIKVAVLKGGTSAERQVSLMTAKKIMENIDYNKYEVLEIEILEGKSLEWVCILIDFKPDIAVSALHGGKGENGSVQGLLECLNIPYTGSKVLGSAIGLDKHLSKELMKGAFIPVPEDYFISQYEDFYLKLDTIVHMGFPMVVKPNTGGSSIGISIVSTKKELIEAIERIKEMKEEILVEKFIEGQEVTCGIMEKENKLTVMSVLDIKTTDGYYDYEARYKDSRSCINFSALPQYLQTMIQEIAKKVFRLLRCSGYGRVDMIVQEEQIYVLEINTLPGLTYRSLIPKAIEGKGDSFRDFLDELIVNELHKYKR